MREAPCLCGSGKKAKRCCLRGTNHWRLPGSEVRVRNTGQQGHRDGCYLHDLGSCHTALSSEHYISRGVLDALGPKIQVSGFPWLKGETKTVGIQSLTTNVLCRVHNSALSPLDQAATRFITAMKAIGVGGNHHEVVSGHDIERWLLKSLVALTVSKNLMLEGQRVETAGLPGDLPHLLEDPRSWAPGAGLWLVHREGDVFPTTADIELRPLFDAETGAVKGADLRILGFSIVLLIDAYRRKPGSPLEHAVYRPADFTVRTSSGTRMVALAWMDDQFHPSILIETGVPAPTP
ncbi:hypothetical protein CRT60_00860 [Azospirillum palustre]|uniref:SEC-C motif-containing protein n=1 Tax=Azospirillum palustre TaxID=2044885 RepID=A0A2B8BMY4_9PROT|nr:SEC-C domain-containing protein [Azospirillum palustre]PGH59215.1 hypothetical protein CRT60_00860 [Azospirillum palustre]